MSESNSYKQIFKNTTFLGGVQILTVTINLVRAKVIALMLGPTGFGVLNLLTSAANVFINLFGFGLNFSSIREFSLAKELDDGNGVARTYLTFKRWLLLSAILGASAVALMCYPLSVWTFSDDSRVLTFLLVSIYVFFVTLNNGLIAFLQGVRELKKLAFVSVVGLALGVAASLPFYYYYGLDGIVLGLIVSSFLSFCVGYCVKKRILIEKHSSTIKESFQQGVGMAKLGMLMVLSTLLGSAVVYLVNMFIGNFGSIEDVGFYQAGMSMTNQYAGLVLAAMGSDYFPRLSAIQNDNAKIREVANYQAEIVVLLVAPLILALLLFMPVVIEILFSKSFGCIAQLARIFGIGLLFKVASFSLGYIPFAKGDKKVFFWLEGIGSNVLQLTLSVLGYYFFGLEGLGYSFLILYVIYFFVIKYVTSKLYQFKYNRSFYKLFIFILLLAVSLFTIIEVLKGIFEYLAGACILIVGYVYSFMELDKRIGILGFVKSLFYSRNNSK